MTYASTIFVLFLRNSDIACAPRLFGLTMSRWRSREQVPNYTEDNQIQELSVRSYTKAGTDQPTSIWTICFESFRKQSCVLGKRFRQLPLSIGKRLRIRCRDLLVCTILRAPFQRTSDKALKGKVNKIERTRICLLFLTCLNYHRSGCTC